ncbi:MAG: hypothetical protein UHK60_12730 [Acutalibacteraceae bacterium]|nr:hypothetical protein [Acutalibacteraceae bacterium]
MSKKKVLSVVLTAAMVASLATVSAVTTSAADTRGKIYFDSTGLGGKAGAQRGTYYCYVWGSKDGALYSWDNKALKMTNEDGENLYSFDIPKTNAEGKEIHTDLVIFHALGGEQTYDTTFSDACIGDTAYVLDQLLENPVDSAQTCKGCAWMNNPDQGAHLGITSTGKVQGVGIVEGETAESIATKFQTEYKAGMDEGKTGYDNPDLLTEEAYNKFVQELQAIIDNPPVPPAPPTKPSDAPTDPVAPTDPTDPVAPTDPTAPVEKPTDSNVADPYGRIPGLPLPADKNVPAKDTNKDVYKESDEFPSDWDGYFNVYYFEVPEEWLTEHKEAKDFEVGFYWYRGGLSNAAWPGVEASKLSVLDENGNDIYADKNIYYGFAPSFATCIIWNNGISDKVAENKKFKLQTDDIKVDDPMSNSIADALYKVDPSIDGAYVAGCLGYVAESYTKTNELTGDLQTVYKVEWKYFNPRTGETTFDPLKDADGNIVTVADDYWEYGKVAVNPYFDLDYDHVNEAEVPTEPAPSTLPPAPTQSATDATKATTATTNNNTNSGKGTVDTNGGSAVVTLATVLLAAMGVTVLARKRRESTNA